MAKKNFRWQFMLQTHAADPDEARKRLEKFIAAAESCGFAVRGLKATTETQLQLSARSDPEWDKTRTQLLVAAGYPEEVPGPSIAAERLRELGLSVAASFADSPAPESTPMTAQRYRDLGLAVPDSLSSNTELPDARRAELLKAAGY
jgi:hypothetical protein